MTNSREHRRRPQPESPPPGKSGDRHRYVAPRLTVYGSIAKLTQSGGSTNIETGVPMMRRACL